MLEHKVGVYFITYLSLIKWLRMKSFITNILKDISGKFKNLTNIVLLSILKIFNLVYGNITSTLRTTCKSLHFVTFRTRFLKIKWFRTKSFITSILRDISGKFKNLTNIALLSILKIFNLAYSNITSTLCTIRKSLHFVTFRTRLLKIFRKIHKVIYFTIYLLYHEVYIAAVKPMLVRGYDVAVNHINGYLVTYRFARAIHNFLKRIYTSLTRFTRRFCLFFWKKFIDFLFFTLYRNRVVIRAWMIQMWYSLSILALLFIFIYFSILGIAHDYVCYNLSVSDNLRFLDFSSYTGIFLLLVTFLNPDNIFLLLYILVTKVGLYDVLFSNWDYLFLRVGYNW
jgi:hypothetical protein